MTRAINRLERALGVDHLRAARLVEGSASPSRLPQGCARGNRLSVRLDVHRQAALQPTRR